MMQDVGKAEILTSKSYNIMQDTRSMEQEIATAAISPGAKIPV